MLMADILRKIFAMRSKTLIFDLKNFDKVSFPSMQWNNGYLLCSKIFLKQLLAEVP